jgi:plastocyanin
MGSMTYYYTAPDAGTYFWHCHITPPEHLQMGMVGQLFVRPQQNRTAAGLPVATSGRCGTGEGILCNAPAPNTDLATNPAFKPFTHQAGYTYAYNDGDGSTRYDVDVPMQMMGFDPNFHYVGMTFNQEQFADMKDKYFMLNGRGYPDTVTAGPIATLGADGASRNAQPMPALVKLDKRGCGTAATPTLGPTCKPVALLRLSNLAITEFHTLASIGVPMKVIAMHGRLLRDLAGNNLYYNSNSITIGGGETADVLIDVSDPAYHSGQTFFIYTTNLDHLSNDAENFGGEMTEIQIQ